MAKRNSDTGKWQKAWFRKLSPKMKCAWLYLLDNCDYAGFWDVDMEMMSFMVGDRIEWDELLSAFEHQIQLIEDKIWLHKFVAFQCGLPLSEKSRFHQKIIQRLEEFDLIEKDGDRVYIGSIDPIQTPKSKSKSISKSKSKSKSKSISKSKGNVREEIENQIDEVIEFFNEIAGTEYRTTTKTYRKQIGARLQESDIETLKKVIEYKFIEWGQSDDEQQRAWFNPETLFRQSKFPKYEQQVLSAEKRGIRPTDIRQQDDPEYFGEYAELHRRAFGG